MTPQSHQKPEDSENIKTKFAIYAFSVLIVIIAVITALFPIDNFDIWWHLKTGEIIISNLSVPTTDIYSFTARGNNWITHEWLAEVIFYGLYSLGGMNLLIIFKVLIAAMIVLMLLNNIRRAGNNNPIIFILIAAAICLGSFRLFIRPHLFTYLFLAFFTIKLSKQDDFFENKTVKWFLIPIMFMIWANLHSGFIIGLGIYWIISSGEFVKCFWTKQKNKIPLLNGLKNILAPVLVASMASLLNPNGIKAFTYPFILASEPVFRNAIAEMVSPFNIISTEKLYWTLLIVVLSFAIYGIWINIRKRPAFSFVLAAVIISALSSIRNSYEAAIITASIMIVTIKEIPRRMLYIGMITALLFVSAFGIYTAKYIRDTRGLGTGVVTDLPYGAADFLEKIEYKGNIFSPLGWGSYFIWKGWPDWKVFIDGRLLVYGPDFLNEYHFIRQNEPEALQHLEQSGAQAVAVPIGQKRWRIRDAVANSNDWQLCYFDDKSVLYLQKNERNKIWLDQWGFNKIDPLKSGYLSRGAQRADITIILDEAARALEQSPGSVTTNAVMARAYFLSSDFTTAAKYYKEAIKIEPRMIDFYYQVATSYHRGGELDSAAAWYEKSIENNPAYEKSYLEYGAMEAANGRPENAIEIWGRALKYNPQGPAKKFIEDIKNQTSGKKDY